jgi:hypothetical protein
MNFRNFENSPGCYDYRDEICDLPLQLSMAVFHDLLFAVGPILKKKMYFYHLQKNP